MKDRIFRPRVPVPSPAPAAKRAWGTSGTWGNQTPALDIDKLRSAYGPLRWLRTEQNFADVAVVESRIGYAATRHLLWTAQAAHDATRDDEVAALWSRAPFPYLNTNMGPEGRDAIVRLIGPRAVSAWLDRPGARTVAALAGNATVPATSGSRPSPRAPWNDPGGSLAARAGGETPGPREAPAQRDTDAVADKVVRVESAEALLDQNAGSTPAVQRKESSSDAVLTMAAPESLAELITRYPELREQVLAWAVRIGGAGYADQIVAALGKRAAVAAGSSADVPQSSQRTSTSQLSDTTAAPQHATSSTERTDTTITHTTRVESVEILHAEEIFADLPANTTTKHHAFNELNAAVRAERHAKQALAVALARKTTGKMPKETEALTKAAAQAVAQATKALDVAKTRLEAATRVIETMIAEARFQSDTRLKLFRQRLAEARTAKHPDTAAIAEITHAIADRKAEIRADVADLKHRDVGHTDDSVFAPVATGVTHHDFAFTDDEHVKVRDHVVSYATTTPLGVDSEGPIDHKQVREAMVTSGLSESRGKILLAISGFEGGFDTVNTYDRAKVTWGFVQWTGTSHSDLRGRAETT